MTRALQITLTGNLDNVGSTSFPVNAVINGRFTAITLASGSVVAYHTA